MSRKKNVIDIKRWIWIGAVPTSIGALILVARVITTYADLPKKVEDTGNKVDKIERYIEVQQKANDLVQEQLNKDKGDEVIYSQDGKYYWDREAKKWKPVK